MWGRPGPFSGILVMAPYPGTRSNMLTREFSTSASVSEKVQKNLGESTHAIGSTISMQTMMELLLVFNEMT